MYVWDRSGRPTFTLAEQRVSKLLATVSREQGRLLGQMGRFASEPLNERQIRVLNSLLDGFEGKLTTSKWAKIVKCSQDTAYRDILDLVAGGALQKDASAGRSTSYSLLNNHARDVPS